MRNTTSDGATEPSTETTKASLGRVVRKETVTGSDGATSRATLTTEPLPCSLVTMVFKGRAETPGVAAGMKTNEATGSLVAPSNGGGYTPVSRLSMIHEVPSAS